MNNPLSIERPNEFVTLQGQGYQLRVCQFSNKGPLVIVTDQNGQEMARGRFDIGTGKWYTSVE